MTSIEVPPLEDSLGVFIGEEEAALGTGVAIIDWVVTMGKQKSQFIL